METGALGKFFLRELSVLPKRPNAATEDYSEVLHARKRGNPADGRT
jgi:hypothetical protein